MIIHDTQTHAQSLDAVASVVVLVTRYMYNLPSEVDRRRAFHHFISYLKLVGRVMIVVCYSRCVHVVKCIVCHSLTVL